MEPEPTLAFMPDAELDEVIETYLKAAQAGAAPSREELVARYPGLEKQLADFFAAQEQFQRLAEPVRQVVTGITAVGTTIRYFGDYELLEEIARGGMGVVYRARQVSLNRIVALKMILAGQLASPEDVQRFHREAEAAANLDHPNIVPIYEVGEHEGQHYFSMKLVDGGNLGQSTCEFRADGRAAARMVNKVARAVHHAHQRGVLHRDLKPANILLDGNGEPHITDFGLAMRVDGGNKLTQSGAIVGTPSYMAPEQARTEKGLSTAVDTYSLGAILYEVLTGQPPFHASTPLDTVLQLLEREPESPISINPAIDRDLATITMKCLEKNPAKRYGSAEALGEDLERWLQGEPIQARPSGCWERFAKWLRRHQAIVASWAVTVSVSLTALLAVAGANKLFSAFLLCACWIGVVVYLLRQQSQLRDAHDKAAETAHVSRFSFRAKVMFGTFVGAVVVWAASLPIWQAAGSTSSTTFSAMLFGALIGMLYGAATRAFRRPVSYPLWLGYTGFIFISSVSRWDWWLIRPYVWVWFGVIICLIGTTLVVALWSERKKSLGNRSHAVISAVRFSALAVGQLGTVIFLAILIGQIGSVIAGTVGALVGELIGGFVGGALSGTIVIWSYPGNQVPAAGGTQLQYSSGSLLVLGMSGTSILWFIFADLPNGIEVRRLSLREHAGPPASERFDAPGGYALVKCAAYFPNRRKVVCGHDDWSVSLWDLENRQELHRLQGHRGPVTSVAVSPDGHFILSGSEDRTIRMWSVDTGAQLCVFRGHWKSIKAVAFTDGGDSAISWSWDGTTRLWKPKE
jgi:hypothetical protein